MADLVTDDAADPSVVDRKIGIGIEERRLQDRSREDNLVGVDVPLLTHNGKQRR